MPTITSLPTLSTTSNLSNVVIPVVDNNSGVPVGKKVVSQFIVNSAVSAAINAAVIVASTATGYVGSTGSLGPYGYTGSRGAGYTGSASTVPGISGYTGSRGAGYTGSASTVPGILGYTGSRGAGYTGSASTTPGALGYTGSSGGGYTGSAGYVGSQGSSSITARTILVGTSTSLANNATGNLTIAGAPSYFLLSMGTSNSSWVRLYIDNASRIADASRSQGIDPTYGSGVIAEIITLGPTTQVITPSIVGYNNDLPPTNNIYCAVTNLTGATNNITITLNVISLGV